ncbi:Nitrogen regulatory protein P-II [Quillaja saponaria]|uniref:Nitrogen regulatory protein P-II n=1 Tax=Quillaja saponaria TaxID=32244 RepID=A0AAD7VJ04_QUISA|nr:Nitrogen regulatory protein P-II [Quillaja saponaria]
MATMAKQGLFSTRNCHIYEFKHPFLGGSSICQYFGDCRFSQRNAALKFKRNASFTPIFRAQITPDYVPDSKFYKVEAILRPWRVSQVSSALVKMGIRGVTVSDVRGFGAQGGSKERHGDILTYLCYFFVLPSSFLGMIKGSEFSEDNFVAKVKMEIVVSKDQVEAVIDKIIEEARTGEIGDGKIFLVPVSDVIRVRTGERGEKAERMSGGRSEISTAL